MLKSPVYIPPSILKLRELGVKEGENVEFGGECQRLIIAALDHYESYLTKAERDLRGAQQVTPLAVIATPGAISAADQFMLTAENVREIREIINISHHVEAINVGSV